MIEQDDEQATLQRALDRLESPDAALTAKRKAHFATLLAEKRGAGLTKAQAAEVAAQQILEDEVAP